jgi:inhibitor of KinA
MTLRLLDAGDAAFTVEWGEQIDPGLLAQVHALDAAIALEQRRGGLPGLIETMPTFRSLTLFFDPLLTGRVALIQALQPLLNKVQQAPAAMGRRWRLPVCYEGEAGPDLASTAQAIGSSVDELIALHSGTEVSVYMLGFLPGFPFMGDVHPRLRLPRRAEPRVRVPAGSVAIAGGLTAIYPWESPGGWHLLGRCPLPLFDGSRDAPSLLAAGDRVSFTPITLPAFLDLEAACKAGEFDARRWRADPGEAHRPQVSP